MKTGIHVWLIYWTHPHTHTYRRIHFMYSWRVNYNLIFPFFMCWHQRIGFSCNLIFISVFFFMFSLFLVDNRQVRSNEWQTLHARGRYEKLGTLRSHSISIRWRLWTIFRYAQSVHSWPRSACSICSLQRQKHVRNEFFYFWMTRLSFDTYVWRVGWKKIASFITMRTELLLVGFPRHRCAVCTEFEEKFTCTVGKYMFRTDPDAFYYL